MESLRVFRASSENSETIYSEMKFVNLWKEACRLILSPTHQSVQTAAMLLLPFHLSSDFMFSKYSTCSPYDRYQEERRWI